MVLADSPWARGASRWFCPPAVPVLTMSHSREEISLGISASGSRLWTPARETQWWWWRWWVRLNSPPHPPTQRASCQRQTVRYHQRSHWDWTNTPSSSRLPESIVNLSRKYRQIRYKQNIPQTWLTYFVRRNIFGSQDRHFCKFILSRFINRRLDLSIMLALACFANTTAWSPHHLVFYLLKQAQMEKSKNWLRHGRENITTSQPPTRIFTY